MDRRARPTRLEAPLGWGSKARATEAGGAPESHGDRPFEEVTRRASVRALRQRDRTSGLRPVSSVAADVLEQDRPAPPRVALRWLALLVFLLVAGALAWLYAPTLLN